jgi:hypothetical protein
MVSRINYIYIGVGIKETFSDNKVILYPNSASDVVYIQTDPFISRGSLRVFEFYRSACYAKTNNKQQYKYGGWPLAAGYVLSTVIHRKASGVRGFLIQH